ncbi:hypothetical protein MSG28_001937 [Choristoneura fumiferana]|uniref:Uncharacterized protein n=1 Tax=Choristoneura fumiferana TaxID=7141 RepID=A0ACC0JT86_CHOFU|nr:hypothetical protein MSG28_001937 [Choristoneura fumiferana]
MLGRRRHQNRWFLELVVIETTTQASILPNVQEVVQESVQESMQASKHVPKQPPKQACNCNQCVRGSINSASMHASKRDARRQACMQTTNQAEYSQIRKTSTAGHRPPPRLSTQTACKQASKHVSNNASKQSKGYCKSTITVYHINLGQVSRPERGGGGPRYAEDDIFIDRHIPHHDGLQEGIPLMPQYMSEMRYRGGGAGGSNCVTSTVFKKGDSRLDVSATLQRPRSQADWEP